MSDIVDNAVSGSEQGSSISGVNEEQKISCTKPDARRDEFKQYLTQSGLMEALTRSLLRLYEEKQKPENAVEYFIEKLSEMIPVQAKLVQLQTENQDLREKLEAAENENNQLNEKLVTTSKSPSKEIDSFWDKREGKEDSDQQSQAGSQSGEASTSAGVNSLSRESAETVSKSQGSGIERRGTIALPSGSGISDMGKDSGSGVRGLSSDGTPVSGRSTSSSGFGNGKSSATSFGREKAPSSRSSIKGGESSTIKSIPLSGLEDQNESISGRSQSSRSGLRSASPSGSTRSLQDKSGSISGRSANSVSSRTSTLEEKKSVHSATGSSNGSSELEEGVFPLVPKQDPGYDSDSQSAKSEKSVKSQRSVKSNTSSEAKEKGSEPSEQTEVQEFTEIDEFDLKSDSSAFENPIYSTNSIAEDRESTTKELIEESLSKQKLQKDK